MPTNRTDIIIIGAGLTGLTLGYLLRDTGYAITILEARDRPGGRIQTLYSEQEAPREMGATWLGKKHEMLSALLSELELDVFPQELGETAVYEPISTSPPQLVRLPPNEEPSYRIAGGSSKLIETLLQQQAPLTDLRFGAPVSSIYRNGRFRVATEQEMYEADFVVSTLPPRLFESAIGCEPSLPPPLCEVMQRTHTWMGESIKISFTYPRPFWREAGKSGTVFSNVGPIPELYDHANCEDDRYALKGFFNGAYRQLSKTERREMALGQLEKYFGARVHDFQSYDEVVWADEPYTYFPYDNPVLPHQHNGDARYREPLHNSRFFLAGSETADQFPGYMEGAVRSAQFVAAEILAACQS